MSFLLHKVATRQTDKRRTLHTLQCDKRQISQRKTKIFFGWYTPFFHKSVKLECDGPVPVV